GTPNEANTFSRRHPRAADPGRGLGEYPHSLQEPEELRGCAPRSREESHKANLLRSGCEGARVQRDGSRRAGRGRGPQGDPEAARGRDGQSGLKSAITPIAEIYFSYGTPFVDNRFILEGGARMKNELVKKIIAKK